ncbi:MAG: ATPase, T2SS/T4P/T4SS family, partial [Pseudomonadota bacterium]
RGVKAQERTGAELGDVLQSLGLLSDSDLAQALSELHGCPLVEAASLPDEPLLADELSLSFLKNNDAVVLGFDDQTVQLASANPGNRFLVKAVEVATGRKAELSVARRGDITACLERLFGGAASKLQDVAAEAVPGQIEGDLDEELLRGIASEAPIIRLVSQILSRGVEMGASDIHVEPYRQDLIVRFRIDGILQDVEKPPVRLAPAILSRLKIMAGLDIAERRLAQDGRIQTVLNGQEVDLRVSTVPTLHGESVVLRILRRDAVELTFPALGIAPSTSEAMTATLAGRHGIFLVTGATGSGKTTTLYAALKMLNDQSRKIITVEDPVEYHLDRISQIQVRPEIDLTFARVLRSIVRQDPDVIMIGEMRDRETAEIGVQAALTGHLVLSTLHTNDAVGAITRLLDMGVDDFLLTSTVNGVLSQRLLRRLCDSCKEPYDPSEATLQHFGVKKEDLTGQLYRAVGCKHCQGRGYQGRTGIYEFISMSSTLRDMVLKRAPGGDILAQACREGTRTLKDDGLAKALLGETTLEEVIRVTRSH